MLGDDVDQITFIVFTASSVISYKNSIRFLIEKYYDLVLHLEKYVGMRIVEEHRVCVCVYCHSFAFISSLPSLFPLICNRKLFILFDKYKCECMCMCVCVLFLSIARKLLENNVQFRLFLSLSKRSKKNEINAI